MARRMETPFETQIDQLFYEVKQVVLTALPHVKTEQRQEVLLLLALMQDVGINLKELLEHDANKPNYKN